MEIPLVANINGDVTEDGSAIAIVVSTMDGKQTDFAFSAAEASKFLSLIVSLAQQAGARAGSPIMPSGRASDQPINVSAVAVAKGRTDTEAILNLQFGPVSMAFSMQRAVLIQQLERLRR